MLVRAIPLNALVPHRLGGVELMNTFPGRWAEKHVQPGASESPAHPAPLRAQSRPLLLNRTVFPMVTQGCTVREPCVHPQVLTGPVTAIKQCSQWHSPHPTHFPWRSRGLDPWMAFGSFSGRDGAAISAQEAGCQACSGDFSFPAAHKFCDKKEISCS